MHPKVLLILLVILNNTLMFGGVHASSISGAEYSAGNTFEIEHSHEHEHRHSKLRHELHQDNPLVVESADDHGHAHKHGIYTQLSCEVPNTYTFAIEADRSVIQTRISLAIINPTYTPPLPPPNL